MRLSVWDKPGIIGSAENFPRHIALPRGCLEAAIALLKDNGIRCELHDKRHAGDRRTIGFMGTLRLDQESAVTPQGPTWRSVGRSFLAHHILSELFLWERVHPAIFCLASETPPHPAWAYLPGIASDWMQVANPFAHLRQRPINHDRLRRRHR